jgi:hypothetical protein
LIRERRQKETFIYHSILALQLTAQTTTLSFFIRNMVVAPLFLPRGNWSFDSGKNNGVVCADVMRHGQRREEKSKHQ